MHINTIIALCSVLCAYSIVSFSRRSLPSTQNFLTTKLTCLLLLLAVLSCADVRMASAAYYDSGRSGDSWEDAYVISSVEDLRTLQNRVNSGEEAEGKYYVLNADIDLTSETNWSGIGDIFPFRGHFDGRNHTVRINSENNNLHAGLFNTIDSGSGSIAVRNLNLTGTITADCAGTIVHYLESGIVENCTFSGTIAVAGFTSNYGAGGIVAHLYGGTVANCRVNANITGNSYAGGIAGVVSSGTIEGCTVEDSTRLTAEQVGGIAGEIDSSSNANISSTSNKWPSIYPLSGNEYTPTPPVPEEFTEWNNHRYQILSEALTWEEARARCTALGGHLATITTQQEQNVITSLLASYEGSYWLGAKADSAGWWQWITGETFERQYQNYADGQPDGSGGFLVVQSNGKWNDVRGDETAAGFICEWDNEPEEVRTAPVAPTFAEWVANPALRADSDGAAPSPVDRSHLRNNPPRVVTGSVFRAAADETLPVSYDARIAIGLPEAREQRPYDTCWAFASIGALEASYRRQKLTSLGEYPDLSELHLAWFTYKSGSYKIDTGLCILNQKGDPEKAYKFLTTNIDTAPVNETEMPYSVATSVDADSVDADIEAFVAEKDFTRLSVKLYPKNVYPIETTNKDYIKTLIREHGAVYFQYYHSPEDYDETYHSLYSLYSTSDFMHAALLVGWDDNFPATNFKNHPSINGAWLVRNSYGANWGDGGYFWLSYDTEKLFSIYVFIASEDIQDPTTEQHLHDEHGETVNITPIWSANLFRAKRDESIIRVTLNTTDNNAEYQLFINNLGKIKPSGPGSVVGEPILSDELPNAGYRTLDLSTPIDVYSGDYYSVIVKMKTTYEYPTAAEGTVEGYSTASVNEGESYFASGDEVPSVWVDGKNLSGDGYNATIRVVTVARPSNNEFKPTITTTFLPSGRVGEVYTFRFEAQGTGPIEWRAGELPRGFSLSREGVLSGQSDSAVEQDVRFTAFNNVGSAEVELRLSIEGDEVLPPEVESPDVPPEVVSPDVPSEEVTSEDVPHDYHGGVIGSAHGGCDSGLGVFGLGAVVLLLFRRR